MEGGGGGDFFGGDYKKQTDRLGAKFERRNFFNSFNPDNNSSHLFLSIFLWLITCPGSSGEKKLGYLGFFKYGIYSFIKCFIKNAKEL